MPADEPRSRVPLGDDMAALAFVQASHLCRGIDPVHLGRLIEGAELQTYAAQSVIICAGERDDGLFVIFDGRVAVWARAEHGWVELAQLERSQIFGEVAVLTRQPRTRNVIALSDTQVVRLCGAAVRRVADDEPRLGRRLAALMAGRAKATERTLLGT